ncbi:reverse transcriptase [compost metagenome]
MTENIKFNRQKIDFLLTDLLPYEKGNHYTHRFFYEYLQSRKKKMNGLFKKMQNEVSYFNSSWHSSPLKFNISKKEESFREISLINPLGLLESITFIELFENDILNIIHNKRDFSARKANRTNSLTYKKNRNQTVYYTNDPVSRNQLLISLESSGTYFKHYPFTRITSLLNDKSFIYPRDNFNLLLKIDIQECFSSIYTHSYKWLITNKTYDSKKLRELNSVYCSVDAYLQNINGSKTNGILVGPEISRLLADFLLIHIDQEVIEILAENNLHIRKDYNIFRFVDDYFIYSFNENVQKKIQETISNVLNKYHLKINESKISRVDKMEVFDSWKLELQSVIEKIENIFLDNFTDFKKVMNSFSSKLFDTEKEKYSVIMQGLLEAAPASAMKSENKVKKIRYIDLRSRVISTINATQEQALICSYILSTILRKIEEEINGKVYINMTLAEFVAFVFFIYSKRVDYSSTQKIIRIFSLLIDKHQIDINEYIENSIERFQEDIFTKFTNDWIDLLLFFINYKINISFKLIENITQSFILGENPVNLAALCLFAESKNVDTNNILRQVNKLIKYKVEKINWDDFFQDELCWWVYIFLSYPKLSKSLKKDLIKKLTKLKNEIVSKKDTASNYSKIIVLDFLLNTPKHYIEWDFTQENYYMNYFFYTKDRTVFNPDIIDQISISR